MGRLAERRILIVGAGQNDFGLDDPPLGNGRAMALLFASEGAAVGIADIDEQSAGRTAALVEQQGGTCATTIGDAADEDDLERMFAETREALGGLDGLVMNVGVGGGLGFRGTSVEDWDRV